MVLRSALAIIKNGIIYSLYLDYLSVGSLNMLKPDDFVY